MKPAATRYLPPFRFRPLLKNVIWGGSFIKYFKNLPECAGMPVGESWEVSGLEGEESVVADGPDAGLTLSELVGKYGPALVGAEPYARFGTRFPILVKYIDAARDLSVQVHPDDDMARSLGLGNGKNEMWHILRCSGGAKIYAGFRHKFSPEEYDLAVASGTIMDHVTAHPARAGETYYLPAGMIHAIGEGIFLIEIQQTCDITYRVYDYDRRDESGRKRELHTEMARKALHYDVYPAGGHKHRVSKGTDASLLDCEWARVRRHAIKGDAGISLPDDSFTIICCTEGELRLSYPGHQFSLSMGCTCLLAAEVPEVHVEGKGVIITVTM